MPKVSIILPVFNTEKYVGKCIKSILSQSYEDFELIIVNDGSNDNSAEICEKAAEKDKRIIYLVQDNKGAASARNAGLDKAIGDYVTFIDSDDCVKKNYLRLLINTSERYKTDLTACEFTNYHINENRIALRDSFDKSFIKKGANVKEFITNKVFYNGSKQKLTNVVCKLFKRNIIVDNHVKFIDGIVEFEDALFLAEYYQYVSVFAYIHRSLYKRRWRDDSLINSYKPNVIRDMTASLSEYNRIKKNLNISTDNEDVFAFEILKIIVEKNILHKENKESFSEKNKKIYNFSKEYLLKNKWQSLDIKKIEGKRDLLKAFLLKNHLLLMWDIGIRFKLI